MVDELTQLEAGGDTYREEVERVLENDDKLIGDVWRLIQKGLTEDKEIADRLKKEKGIGTINHYQRIIRAIVDGILQDTTTNMAQRYGNELRRFAKRHQESLSSATVAELERRADKWVRSE